jgi:hypothetical protein
MKNKVIAVTAPLPYLDANIVAKPGFDESVLYKRGVVLNDGRFVSYGEMPMELLKALYNAQFDEVDALPRLSLDFLGAAIEARRMGLTEEVHGATECNQ